MLKKSPNQSVNMLMLIKMTCRFMSNVVLLRQKATKNRCNKKTLKCC